MSGTPTDPRNPGHQLTPDSGTDMPTPSVDTSGHVGSYDTSAPGDPRSLPQHGSPIYIKALRKIHEASQRVQSTFGVAHEVQPRGFSKRSDYKALNGLVTYMVQDDFSAGDIDALARDVSPEEAHMLMQIPID